MNQTAEKFGYPASLLREYDAWAVLLRPVQVTLGSLVLVCREPVEAFGQISETAASELKRAVADIESALGEAFSFDRINYLMLMMVDPDVHFHVLPRYAEQRAFEGRTHRDEAWPGPPRITADLGLSDAEHDALLAHLRPFFS